ncbi:MAG: discoidin domain-containing protein, partial [Acidimicrobiales bacterium]
PSADPANASSDALTAPAWVPSVQMGVMRQRVLTARRGRTSLAFAAVVSVASVAFAGCSNSDSSDPAFEPIDAIVVGDIEIETDPSGRSATLTVETAIPVACAVIYGTDDSFGSIAVDSDMQAGAHADHHPLLTGLAPDTEYQYILQGSDTAGTIYRSDVMSFRTPPAADTGVGANIAPTGTVTAASSSFSDSFAPELAVDGDLATEWSTAGDGDDAWIEIDLGEDHEIAAVAFHTRQMADGTAITNTFTATIEGTTFGPFPTGAEPAELDEAVTGRVVRIDAVETTGGNTGATEIEIFTAQEG